MTSFFQTVLAVALLGLAGCTSLDRTAADKSAGPQGLRVLPNLVAQERHPILKGANDQTADALADPRAVAGPGWAGAAESRLRREMKVDEGQWRQALAAPSCRFHSWDGLLDWYVAALSAGQRLEPQPQLVACAQALPLPAEGEFSTPLGKIRVAGPGNDEHWPAKDVFMDMDTGGDDVWHLAPAPPGSLRVRLDLAGNDRWLGDNTALQGLEVVIDLAGNDFHESADGGQAAAADGGIGLLVDCSGNDRYQAGNGAQGSASSGGMAVLMDGGGDDLYAGGSRVQAFAGAAARALLWDLGGNDSYQAEGPADPLQRGGPFSYAQGFATGRREGLGGGTAILRDEAGNDRYQAGMFAQAAGYYDGLGILRDGGGNDAYRAARYAQGAGVHRAVGVLEDGGGDDHYALNVGVGQGMGHDLALGVLHDFSGRDGFSAGALAQGAATLNGIGVLIKTGPADFRCDSVCWGQDHVARGLPGMAFLLGVGGDDRFSQPGAPFNAAYPISDRTRDRDCVPSTLSLPHGIGSVIAALPEDDLEPAFVLRRDVGCWLDKAEPEQKQVLAEELLAQLTARPLHHGWLSAGLLTRLPLPPAQAEAAAAVLAGHPSCQSRALGLKLLRRAGLEPWTGAKTDLCLQIQAALRLDSDQWGDAAAVMKAWDRGY